MMKQDESIVGSGESELEKMFFPLLHQLQYERVKKKSNFRSGTKEQQVTISSKEMPSVCFDTKQHKKGEEFSLEGGSAPMEESPSRMFDPKLIPSRRAGETDRNGELLRAWRKPEGGVQKWQR